MFEIAEGATVSASNLLLAPSADVKDGAQCIPVQLASGSDARKALNLKDNPGNLGKKVKIEGSLEAYFNQPGLKTPTNFVIE